MPRPISITLLAILFLAKPSLADEKAKPSPVAKRILDKAVAEVKRNRQEFDKANEKPLSEARQELQNWSTKLIKDGKTDEATAILGQVKTLEADVMRMANAPAPVAGGEAVPQKPLLKRMAGKWEWGNAVLIVEGAGDAVYAEKDGSKVYCRGRVTGVSPNRAKIDWACPHWFIHVVDDDTLISFEGDWDSTGNGRLFKRVR